jgi:hypothetical protein
MLTHLMNNEIRAHPQVIRWINKISECSRQLQILRKDVQDRERDIERLNQDIDSKRALMNNAILSASILINELSENGANVELDDIFIEGQAQRQQRQIVHETAKYLKWIYTVDNLDEHTQEYRAEVLARTADLN